MLGTKIILQFILDNFANLISFSTTIIIAKLFGPEVLGLLGFFLAVIGMFSLIGDFGLSQAHIKKISEGKDIVGANSIFVFAKLVLTLLIFGLSLTYLFLGRQFGAVGIEKSDRLIFLFILIGFIFSYFGQSLLLTLQAKKQVAKYNIPFILARIIKLVVILFAFVFSFHLIGIAQAYFLEGITILFLALFFFKQFKLKKPKFSSLKVYFNYALPFLIWAPTATLAGNMDRLILKNFWGVKEVGLFFAIQSLVILPQSFSTAAMNLFFPHVSSIASRAGFRQLQSNTDLVVKYLTMVTIPFIVAGVVFSQIILETFFGPAFNEAVPILRIFLVAVLILTVSRPYSYLLLGSNGHKKVAYLNVALLIIMVVLEFIFIPNSLFGIGLFGLGAKGAAISSLITWLIGLIVFVYLAQKDLKVKFYKPLAKQFLAGGLMFIYMLMLLDFFGDKILYQLMILIMGIIVFVLSLAIFGEIKKDDISYFLYILKPKSFIDSIKKE